MDKIKTNVPDYLLFSSLISMFDKNKIFWIVAISTLYKIILIIYNLYCSRHICCQWVLFLYQNQKINISTLL